MLSFARLICCKDLKIVLSGWGHLAQSILLGLLLIFIFSLSKNPGEQILPQEASSIFWISSTFCQILIFNQLFALEESNSTRECLILSPRPLQGIWLGKAVAGFLLLIFIQIIFLPATIIFLTQQISGPIWPGLSGLFSADMGIVTLGSLLGAVAQGQTGRESLLSIILFPLLMPLLLASISLGSQTLGANTNIEPHTWLGLIGAFDGIFLAAGLALFGFIYGRED